MNHADKELIKARWLQQISDERAAGRKVEQQSRPEVTDEFRSLSNEDKFAAAFTPGTHTYNPRHAVANESPWDAALRLAEPTQTADDDVTAAPADPLPVNESRARQTAMAASADDLFDTLAQRLQATPEAVTPSPDTDLRRLYRNLPGDARQRIADAIQASDYGLPGYFTARGFGDDYTAVLIGAALARRLDDARRLDPSVTPAALLDAMAGTAS